MKTWICLFRGINVGGKNVVPMQALRAAMAEGGCDGVKTYIQSGNAVFRHRAARADTVRRAIADTVDATFGIRPETLVLTPPELEAVIDGNPFADAAADPSRLHAFLLTAEPRSPDLDALNRLKSPSESFALKKGVFYLHAPDGIGRSKLAQQAERYLRVPATARNWRTVTKLAALARQLDV